LIRGLRVTMFNGVEDLGDITHGYPRRYAPQFENPTTKFPWLMPALRVHGARHKQSQDFSAGQSKFPSEKCVLKT
jgi:hypothetical protein